MSFKAYDTGYRALGGVNVPAGGVPPVFNTVINQHGQRVKMNPPIDKKTYKEKEQMRKINAMSYIPKEKFIEDSRKKITASVHFRENLLKTQKLMNMINEYERINNIINNQKLVNQTPSHVLEKRKEELKQYAKNLRSQQQHEIFEQNKK
jgi:valyl-tRNA synthetase